MTSWSLIEDSPLTPQVPEGGARGWSPFPPIHVTRPPTRRGWLSLPGKQDSLDFPQQEPASQEQGDSRCSTPPALLSTCASQGLRPPPIPAPPGPSASPCPTDAVQQDEAWGSGREGAAWRERFCLLCRPGAWGVSPHLGGQICPSVPRGSLSTCIE